MDRASLSWDPGDEALAFELDDHPMDGRWCDLEEVLHIGFRGGSSIELGVEVDERQVLTLLVGEVLWHAVLAGRQGSPAE